MVGGEALEAPEMSPVGDRIPEVLAWGMTAQTANPCTTDEAHHPGFVVGWMGRIPEVLLFGCLRTIHIFP